MASSSDLILGPFLLPVRLEERARHFTNSPKEKKKILMVDKYFITET